MSYTYTPKSEDEYQKEQDEKFKPWPAGIVDYEIAQSEEKTSKSGKPMFVLDVAVFNDKGERKNINYYLGAWNEWSMSRIFEANGDTDRFKSGHVDAYDLVGKVGKCLLGIQKGQPKPDGSGDYPDRNEIKEFLKVIGTRPAASAKPELDDEIPF